MRKSCVLPPPHRRTCCARVWQPEAAIRASRSRTTRASSRQRASSLAPQNRAYCPYNTRIRRWYVLFPLPTASLGIIWERVLGFDRECGMPVLLVGIRPVPIQVTTQTRHKGASVIVITVGRVEVSNLVFLDPLPKRFLLRDWHVCY